MKASYQIKNRKFPRDSFEMFSKYQTLYSVRLLLTMYSAAYQIVVF